MVDMKKSKKNKRQRNNKRKPNRKNNPAAAAPRPADGGGVDAGLVMALKAALEHQQIGRLDEAEKYYRKALEIDPNNPIALHLLGGLAQQNGQHQEAVEHFIKALKGSPDDAEIHNNLGNSLAALGRYEEAARYLQTAVDLNPDYALALNNLGAVLTEADRPEEAIGYIRKSLQLRPDYAAAYNNLGNAQRKSGKFEEAVESFSEAIKINPDFFEASYNLGVACEREKLFDDAIDAYRQAIAINPEYIEACYNLGNVYKEMGDLEDARSQYDRVLELNPEHAEAHNNLGMVLYESGQVPEAEECWLAAIRLDPEMAEAESNLANILREAGRTDEAIARYQRAIALRPDHAEAHNNLGVIFSEVDRLRESADCFRSAIELDGDLADAHMNLANILFMLGDVAGGWRQYEWRSGAKDFESPLRSFPQTPWDGAPLTGKTILLWGEQGIGDEIRYAGLIPDMLEKGAGVFIECTPRLASLLARSFPSAKVRPYPFDEAESGNIYFDFQCPFPGLGRFLRPDTESFAAQRKTYLVADPGRVEFWRKRLAETGPRPKIGINWRSIKVIDRWRHFYATVDELAPIMTLPGVDFVNLTPGVRDDELAEFEKLYGIGLLGWDDIDLQDDQDEVAALNSALDMVVSCLSAVSEMSGALGIPTLGFMGEKRHFMMLGTGDAIWYPQTRYFSKNRDENWQPVFEDIAREIRRTFALP